MVHFEFGQDRLTQPHPLKAIRVRSKVFSSYSQRPCSGSLGSFCKIILFFAARAGVVKPRQPLCDLNPFDSVFLILRRVGVGTKVVRTLLPEHRPRVEP